MTDRLSATDAAVLYGEDASTPMLVGGVVILEPDPGTFSYQHIVDLVESRLSLVPRYRQRVRMVPGRLARPVWVDDDNFDLSYHVRRSALPRPGTPAQLDELIGRLISRPLDRSRPLWEMYIVEGLADGRIAIVNKTHQAMVDRIGAVDVAAAILDVDRRPRTLPGEPWIPTPPPSDVDLVIDAVADITARPVAALDLLRLAGADVGSAVSRVTDAGADLVQLVRRTVSSAPRSPFNVRIGGQRRFATYRVDLAEIKAIRAVHGGSVNDVILAVITGALRTWLLARGEAVTASTTLRALVPMSVRPPAAESTADALPVVSYLVDLPIAEANPGMRLHQVSYAMGAHLESGRQVGADSLLRLGRFAPPTLHGLGARVAGQLSQRSYNLLVTNAPGPQVPLYAAGAPVVAMYPVAPLAGGHALAVACTSYHGGVFFGVTADRDAFPDVAQLAEHIGEAVVELLPPAPAPVDDVGTARAGRRSDGAGRRRRPPVETEGTR